MPVINILPKEISELIAAGEVVDRPASIVKELVENSIDAGASIVTIEIKNGGISYIRVTDNGCGIEKDDLEKAFVRHATSKITLADDLDSIATLGFRGEALPSMAAVCRICMTTRTKGQNVGWKLEIDGNQINKSEVGCPVGTTLEVKDLFFNTPARMKFLKRDVTEGNAVATLIDKIAMSNPAVSFKFIREGQIKLATPGDGALLSVLRIINGSELASQIIEVNAENEGVGVRGFISKPGIGKPTRVLQSFFINSRYVRSKTCESAVEEAYKTRLMGGKFPICFLNITIDPSLVDVNVHPAKLEVRFFSERVVYNSVYCACASALIQSEQNPYITPARRNITAFSLNDFDYSCNQTVLKHEYKHVQSNPLDSVQNEPVQSGRSVVSFHDSTNRSYAVTKDDSDTKSFMPLHDASVAVDDLIISRTFSGKDPVVTQPPRQTEPQKVYVETVEENKIPYTILGEAFDTYIIIIQGDNILFIDKHAAHERYIYNSLKALKEQNSFEKQILLAPQAVSLSRSEYFALTENMEVLSSVGITAEDFGEGALLVREIPMMFSQCDMSEILSEIAGKIISNKKDMTPDFFDELLYSVSCRAAVMAGKESKMPELRALAEIVLNGDVRVCPHGRPAIMSMNKRQLEKMFGRIQ